MATKEEFIEALQKASQSFAEKLKVVIDERVEAGVALRLAEIKKAGVDPTDAKAMHALADKLEKAEANKQEQGGFDLGNRMGDYLNDEQQRSRTGYDPLGAATSILTAAI